jgi:hypothetical protein
MEVYGFLKGIRQGKPLQCFFNNKNPNLHPWGLKPGWLGCTSTSLTMWARLTSYWKYMVKKYDGSTTNRPARLEAQPMLKSSMPTVWRKHDNRRKDTCLNLNEAQPPLEVITCIVATCHNTKILMPLFCIQANMKRRKQVSWSTEVFVIVGIDMHRSMGRHFSLWSFVKHVISYYIFCPWKQISIR